MLTATMHPSWVATRTLMSRTDAQKASDKQEKRTAETYRGSVNLLSGAGFWKKNDVTSESFLIENKTKLSPSAKSYTLKSTDLRDLTKRALLEGRMPLFQLDLGGQRYVILNEDDWLEMVGL